MFCPISRIDKIYSKLRRSPLLAHHEMLLHRRNRGTADNGRTHRWLDPVVNDPQQTYGNPRGRRLQLPAPGSACYVSSCLFPQFASSGEQSDAARAGWIDRRPKKEFNQCHHDLIGRDLSCYCYLQLDFVFKQTAALHKRKK
jgi:hypothetical protein